MQESIAEVWADAIQKFEGWFPGSRSFRDNNPGNLEETGTAGKDGVYARFATYADGRAALVADIRAKMKEHPSFSILQIMNIYAPSTDHNDPERYADYVAQSIAKATGRKVNAHTTSSELLESA